MLLSFNVAAKVPALGFDYGFAVTHFEEMDNPNEDNKHISVEYTPDIYGIWYVNASTFDNTYYNRSYTVGGGVNVIRYYGLRLDVLGGVVYGYTKDELGSLCVGKACAYMALRASYTYDINNNWAIKPSAKLLGYALEVGLGVERRF